MSDLFSPYVRYYWEMRRLTPTQVLTIIATRLERRAAILERVGQREYLQATLELRNFAAMVRRAIDYTRKVGQR